ncbi:MAG: hypothetical protein R3E91_03780 [Chlamydiales bacterium]
METLQDFKVDLALLVEGGLIAIKQGDEESAKKLFNAVGILDPQNMVRKMGYGIIALHKMDIKTSQKHFREILQIEKTNWRAQVFLAFSHILSVLQEGSPKEKYESLEIGATLAQEVLEKSNTPSTLQLAKSLLEWEKELQDKVKTSP